jgi:hypothetical protein
MTPINGMKEEKNHKGFVKEKRLKTIEIKISGGDVCHFD